MMLQLLKRANHLRGKFESALLDRAAAEPIRAQQEFLLRTLRRNATSAFGVEHSFARIKTESDYRRLVPVRDFEGLRPYIKRIVAGEHDVLTKREPFILTMTSGTTGEPKYIPITRESQALNSSLMRQWLYRAQLDHPGLMEHASLGIVSRAIEGYTSAGLPYGSASGLIYKNIPWLIRRAYAIPYLVSELDDYDERYFVAARFALSRSISFIATPNASTLLRLAQICAEQQEKLIRAIHDGTLGLDNAELPDTCARLARLLKPDRERAASLSRIVAQRGSLRLGDCWPDLKLIGCWIGGSAGVQVKKLAAHYGEIPVRDLGYLASEGRITVPFKDETPAGILALRSSYYEFIPEEESESAEAHTLSSHELEQGRRYSILLTTASGLYRYKINDIVEVAGFYKRAPLLAFVRKGGEMANITGEKMHVNHFVQVITEVGRRFDLAVEQFRAVPDVEASRYEIYLELEREVPHARMRDEILPALDSALAQANVEYEQKRESRRLEAPRLHLMTKGWAEESLRRHVAAGKRDTQYKWRILCPERCAEDKEFIAATIETENSLHQSQALKV
jgi:hypothetical protein